MRAVPNCIFTGLQFLGQPRSTLTPEPQGAILCCTTGVPSLFRKSAEAKSPRLWSWHSMASPQKHVTAPQCHVCYLMLWKIAPKAPSKKIWPNHVVGGGVPLHPSLFCDTGGGGGVEILEVAGTFSGQALLLSYPYPKGGGGGPVKEAGTHSPPCPQYPPNIKPHAMQSNRYFTLNLFPNKISASPCVLHL